MEGSPHISNEAFREDVESNVEQDELLGDELQYELAKEAGHIVVNPLSEDHDFVATNDNEDDDDDNI